MNDLQNHAQMQVPLEPVLPMSEIQGIAAPGFLKPRQTLIGFAAGATPEAALALKKFLRGFARDVSTAAETLADRRRHRSAGSSQAAAMPALKPLVGIGFTFTGLRKLTPGAAGLPGDAFRQGLAARSAYLGDPTGPDDEGNPVKWKVGAPAQGLDALIVVAGDTRERVDASALAISKRLTAAGFQITYSENGDVREDLPGHEHFGFNDGISQPGIRGRASDDPHDFLTTRHIAEGEQPNHSLFGYPGQDLVWRV